MKKLRFAQLQKDNEEQYMLFEGLMIPYNQELDNHKGRETSRDFILKITRGILNMQGPYDRHLELCYDGDNLISFLTERWIMKVTRASLSRSMVTSWSFMSNQNFAVWDMERLCLNI